jgi:hypothetical protein
MKPARNTVCGRSVRRFPADEVLGGFRGERTLHRIMNWFGCTNLAAFIRYHRGPGADTDHERRLREKLVCRNHSVLSCVSLRLLIFILVLCVYIARLLVNL